MSIDHILNVFVFPLCLLFGFSEYAVVVNLYDKCTGGVSGVGKYVLGTTEIASENREHEDEECGKELSLGAAPTWVQYKDDGVS